MGIAPKKATLEEYFAMETATGEKLEYINQTIRSMAGTSIEHETICNNLVQVLYKCLRKKNLSKMFLI